MVHAVQKVYSLDASVLGVVKVPTDYLVLIGVRLLLYGVIEYQHTIRSLDRPDHRLDQPP